MSTLLSSNTEHDLDIAYVQEFMDVFRIGVIDDIEAFMDSMDDDQIVVLRRQCHLMWTRTLQKHVALWLFQRGFIYYLFPHNEINIEHIPRDCDDNIRIQIVRDILQTEHPDDFDIKYSVKYISYIYYTCMETAKKLLGNTSDISIMKYIKLVVHTGEDFNAEFLNFIYRQSLNSLTDVYEHINFITSLLRYVNCEYYTHEKIRRWVYSKATISVKIKEYLAQEEHRVAHWPYNPTLPRSYHEYYMGGNSHSHICDGYKNMFSYVCDDRLASYAVKKWRNNILRRRTTIAQLSSS